MEALYVIVSVNLIVFGSISICYFLYELSIFILFVIQRRNRCGIVVAGQNNDIEYKDNWGY
jgi:hypothetical protein